MKMNSPWLPVKRNSVKFDEIVSEEMAKCSAERNWSAGPDSLANNEVIRSEVIDDNSFSETELCDHLIAQLLQSDFDNEHDKQIKLSETKWNQNSKVALSFDNYLKNNSFDLQSGRRPADDPDSKEKKKEKNLIEDAKKRLAQVSKERGYVKIDGEVITKHDNLLTSRVNTSRFMDCDPGICTGDGEKFDMKLTNKVYNSLKTHLLSVRLNHKSNSKGKKGPVSLYSQLGLDKKTCDILENLLASGVLSSINNVIGEGKESIVLHATLSPDFNETHYRFQECALKVYKTNMADFKLRDQYIVDDARFKNRTTKTGHHYVYQWAEKEYLNLNRLQKCRINCAQVIDVKKNVLLMSFIGENRVAAPKLKEMNFDSNAVLEKAYTQVVSAMKILYQEADLIHSDLSEFNILWHRNRCWLIDVSQTVEPTHTNAFEFLIRDCSNIVHFFKKKGLLDIPSAEKLFFEITKEPYSKSKANKVVERTIINKHQEFCDFSANQSETDTFEENWAKIKSKLN